MRIVIATAIVLVNFILQTTALQYLEIRGVFPNTSLILVVSYALLRGRKEGAIFGVGVGLLFDVFFGAFFGAYTLLYAGIGYYIGRNEKQFYRENFILPILFCISATAFFEGLHFLGAMVFQQYGDVFYFAFSVLLPTLVYTVIVVVPIYRFLFGVNEWLELKEKYKYRLF